MSSLTKDLWKRTGADEMGDNAMALAVGFFFTCAVGVLTAGTVASYGWQFSWLLLIGTFLGAIAGIFIFTLSSNSLVSFVGVSLMSGCLGLMVGPAVASYHVEVIIKALVITAGITATMSVLGIMFPKTLENFGGLLLAGLILLIVGNLVRAFLPMLGIHGDSLGILDWIGAGIFTTYIWYDWGRAMRLPHTVDNAIDASGALVLDVANLFLNIVRILSGTNRD